MIEQSHQKSFKRTVDSFYRAPSLDGTGVAEGEQEAGQAYVVVTTSHSPGKEFSSSVGVQHVTTNVVLYAPFDRVRVLRTPVARYSDSALVAEHRKALAVVAALVDQGGVTKDPEGAFGALAGITCLCGQEDVTRNN